MSVPTNIVEGSARRTTRDHLHFLGLAKRLVFLADSESGKLVASYTALIRGLQALVASLDKRN